MKEYTEGDFLRDFQNFGVDAFIKFEQKLGRDQARLDSLLNSSEQQCKISIRILRSNINHYKQSLHYYMMYRQGLIVI